MESINSNNDLLDLGSDPAGEDFDPFAADDDNDADVVIEVENEAIIEENTEQSKSVPTEAAAQKTEVKEADPTGFADKSPVFEYAGATENIDDASKTFDELRIEKSADFPELEDGKRVSWTVEYGKITKTVSDPKGTSVGKMKSDIELSKEFTDSLKKPRADKNPVCKVKPRVTAQSKGMPSAYKGVFVNLEEVETAGKVISVLPARDGKVYEIRNAEMGKFITPVVGCELLSEIRAGFIPALPRIPSELMMKVFAFFRHFITNNGAEKEALLNIYWDKLNREYIIDVPEQVASKISVSACINGEFTDERYIHYMDVHSHNTMKAFVSQIDDQDEKATRLDTVVGKLNACVPEVKTRISNGGKFLDIDPAEVLEPVGVTFPKEWIEKVRFWNPSDGIKAKCGEVKDNVRNFIDSVWTKLTKLGDGNALRA
jgi:hypothetical protein